MRVRDSAFAAANRYRSLLQHCANLKNDILKALRHCEAAIACNLGLALAVVLGVSLLITSILAATPILNAFEKDSSTPKLETGSQPAAVTALTTRAPLVIDAPTNLRVTSVSSSSINLSWSAPSGTVDSYQIERSQSLTGPFSQVGTALVTNSNDATVSSNNAYLYRVRAVAGGVPSSPSNIALGTAISFTDPALKSIVDDPTGLTVTTMKVEHVTELRTAVNAVRAVAGLSAATWTDPSLSGVIVQAVHIQQLRDRLGEALLALSLPAVSYTDPVLSTGANGTLVKKVHIEQLRQGASGIASGIAQISNINVVVNCNTSALINFRTSVPSRAFIEYGLTTGYGLSTIDDPVRFYTEHAVQLTGLNANTTYHFRINANSNELTQSSDQVITTASSGGVCPALPVQVDSRMPDMTGAVEKTVKVSGGDYTPAQFQTALNDAGTANEKRIITVDAGLTLTGSWTMPANADQNWIIIRSSAHASLTEGKRVFPSDAGSMFKIQNNNMDPAIKFAAASNHIRFIGVEVTVDPAAMADAPGGATQGGLIQFQANLAGSAANLPRFIGFDRCYVHGHFNKNTMRGALVTGEDLFFIDSYWYDFHHKGFDAQAILGLDVKRWKILNCTLVGSGESFMWGGAGLNISGYVIGELEYLRNHMYMPIGWKENHPSYLGFEWTEKNLFECKTCSKVLVFGNFLGGTSDSQGGFWPDAQPFAVNLKLEQGSVGPTTCELMQDIVWYKNLTKNVHAPMHIPGRTVPAQGCTNSPDRVWLLHNIAEADATTWTPDPDATAPNHNAMGWSIGGVHNLRAVHNTTINATPPQGSSCGSVFSDGTMVLVADPITPKFNGLIFRDNIVDFRACGIAGGGALNNGTASLDGVYTGWIFTNNGIMRTSGPQANFPAGNIWATSWPPQLVNFNNGIDGNYRIASGSTWDNAASDGTDLGADIDGVEGATANTPTGNWPSP